MRLDPANGKVGADLGLGSQRACCQMVVSPDGKHLGRIETGQRTSNCNWGDDGSTLYLTADSYICRVKTKTKEMRILFMKERIPPGDR